MSNDRGTIILELLCALTIITLLCLYMIPIDTVSSRVAVCMESYRVAALIRYAQRVAQRVGAVQQIQFDLVTSQYRYRSREYTLFKSVRFGADPAAYGPPAAPQHRIVDPITYRDYRLYCYPNGSVSAGSVYLTDDSLCCGYAITTAVAPYPCVRIYRYNNGWVLVQ